MVHIHAVGRPHPVERYAEDEIRSRWFDQLLFCKWISFNFAHLCRTKELALRTLFFQAFLACPTKLCFGGSCRASEWRTLITALEKDIRVRLWTHGRLLADAAQGQGGYARKIPMKQHGGPGRPGHCVGHDQQHLSFYVSLLLIPQRPRPTDSTVSSACIMACGVRVTGSSLAHLSVTILCVFH